MKVREIIKDNTEWIPNERYDEVKPLVSVILPTYSRAKSGLLKQCIESVLNQSFQRLELIIVIDASTDGTIEICKRYQKKDPRVNIILHKKNVGLPAISCYEGYCKTRGDYIAWIFDDNEWKLDAISKTFDFMEMNDVKASYGITQFKDPLTDNIIRLGNIKDGIENILFFTNYIGNGAVVLHREVIETVGLYDPHLSLTRICDWDFWRRIIDHYKFEYTGIEFTFEYGPQQTDSLGNRYKRDQWFERERWSHRNNDELLLDSYLDIDIAEYSESSSSHYLKCLYETLEQYEKKFWFDKKELENIKSARPNYNHRYGLVICDGKSASLISFTRCSNSNITLLYSYAIRNIHSAIGYCDFMVFVRNIFMDYLNKLASDLKIPVYYYVDDNYKELMIDYYDPTINLLGSQTTRKNLKQFSGVIVSSKTLQNYFQKSRLHKDIILLPPVGKEKISKKTDHSLITIGFMGGSFRMTVFEKCVIPSIRKIAKKQPLRLICPCTPETEEDFLKYETNNLEIIPFYRTLNFDYLLNEYNKIGVDIIVHCGGNQKNNIYKTMNVLLHAVTLGAALIVSDVEPYNTPSEELDGCYLMVRNTPEAWESALRNLIENQQLRQSVVSKAENYCNHHYAEEIVWKDFEHEIVNLPFHDDFFMLKRFEKYTEWITINASINESHLVTTRYKPFVPEELCFSGEIKGKRRYGFEAPGLQIREAGLLFAVIGKCEGTIDLVFSKKSKPDEKVLIQLDIENLVKDNYTNFNFPSPMVVKKGELIYMDIEIKYTSKHGYVGLFETAANRTFMYKVMNKLNHPLPGKNALFIDCRE